MAEQAASFVAFPHALCHSDQQLTVKNTDVDAKEAEAAFEHRALLHTVNLGAGWNTKC